jgi:hypothetical protein
VFSWAASGSLIYYAAELKQYSLDVLVAGIFFLFFQRQRELPFYKAALIFCVLPLLGLFSTTTFLFLFFLSWNLVFLALQEIRFRKVLGVYAAVLAGVVVTVYYYDLRLVNKGLIAAYPQYFISIKSAGAFLKTLTEGTNNLISRWFAVKPLWVRFITRFFLIFGVLEMFLGFRKQFKEDQGRFYSIKAMALVLFLELILLSMFGMFPFRLPRAVLFFCPIWFFLTIQFFVRLEKKWKRFSFILQGAYACFLFVMAVLIMRALLPGNFSSDLTADLGQSFIFS